MPTDEINAISNPRQPPFLGPRQQVALLIVGHLGLAFLAAWPGWCPASGGRSDSPDSLIQPILAVIFGFQIGQIVLLASWGTLAGQPWFLRIPRFLTFTAWTLLSGFLGEYVYAGDMAKLMVEENAAVFALMFVSPIVVLFVYRVFSRRSFIQKASSRLDNPWQFSTRRLLLITAELAALLALARIVLPSFLKVDEFWAGMTGHRTEELIPIAVSLTILPVVFFAFARNRTWQGFLAIGLYLLPASLGLAWEQLSYMYIWMQPDYGNWWHDLGLTFLDYLWTHLSAAATILITYYLVRCMGYDFRRRDELPLASGLNSSNARNSATSASA